MLITTVVAQANVPNGNGVIYLPKHLKDAISESALKHFKGKDYYMYNHVPNYKELMDGMSLTDVCGIVKNLSYNDEEQVVMAEIQTVGKSGEVLDELWKKTNGRLCISACFSADMQKIDGTLYPQALHLECLYLSNGQDRVKFIKTFEEAEDAYYVTNFSDID